LARRKHIVGACHLCGDHTKLSFEHVPPKAAFNDRPVVQVSIEKLIKKESDLDNISGKTFQRGAGGYTLCEKCNSLTGGWYGPAYVDWIYQVTRILLLSKGSPTLYYCILFKFPGNFSKKMRKRKKIKIRSIFDGTN
jgi:hypothetical protein